MTLSAPNNDELLESERPLVGHAAVTPEEIAERIIGYGKGWSPAEPIALGAIRWTPHLVNERKKWVLHIHLGECLPNYVARRLRAAIETGYRVNIALYTEALYQSETLELLAEIDAYTYIIDDPSKPKDRRHYLAAMADLEIPAKPTLRKQLGLIAWNKLAEGTANDKGRRLEALLAFILSQVNDFKIFSRNYRNKTQEIDIVVQVVRLSGRSWSMSGSPFILVESKNTADKIGQPTVSLLIRKLETKRGTTQLGFLFSVSGFTGDAVIEELRLSQTALCVAMFDGAAIKRLIEADMLDSYLESEVNRALLR